MFFPILTTVVYDLQSLLKIIIRNDVAVLVFESLETVRETECDQGCAAESLVFRLVLEQEVVRLPNLCPSLVYRRLCFSRLQVLDAKNGNLIRPGKCQNVFLEDAIGRSMND